MGMERQEKELWPWCVLVTWVIDVELLMNLQRPE
jgi:hypothetical protein